MKFLNVLIVISFVTLSGQAVAVNFNEEDIFSEENRKLAHDLYRGSYNLLESRPDLSREAAEEISNLEAQFQSYKKLIPVSAAPYFSDSGRHFEENEVKDNQKDYEARELANRWAHWNNRSIDAKIEEIKANNSSIQGISLAQLREFKSTVQNFYNALTPLISPECNPSSYQRSQEEIKKASKLLRQLQGKLMQFGDRFVNDEILTKADARFYQGNEGEKEKELVIAKPSKEQNKETTLESNFFQSNEAILLTPHLQKAIQTKLENMTVEENPMKGAIPEAGSKVIRRTWEDYTQKHGNHPVIVFQSGHKGPHSHTYNTSQSPEYYMIDMCWQEVAPDAVLDVNNPGHMAYIPSDEVDLIVSDDSRSLKNDTVAQLARVLKKGGKIAFKPGTGMGWPAYESTVSELEFDDSGRYAWSNNYGDITNIHKDEEEKEKFIKKATELANSYYTQRGYSHVEFDKDTGCFVLTK